MARRFRLNRRSFFVGAGGAAIALPLLEIMDGSTARASQSVPSRYIVSMTGTTMLGTGGGTGADFEFPSAYQALEPIRDYVSFVRNLALPEGPAGSIPPGGREANAGHGSVVIPLVTGHRREGGAAIGPSSDQVAADVLGTDTRFRSLNYRVQASSYGGGEGYMSVDNNHFPVGPIASPRLAYDQLFAGFSPPDGGSAPPPSDRVLRGASVLDLVLRRSDRLHQVLGAPDRIRLEEHFDQIRALELRMREISEGGGVPTGGNATCESLLDPGTDPSVTQGTTDTNGTSGWSDEDKRAIVLADLIHMAFACDLSRVATYMIGYVSSAINMSTVMGLNFDAHDCTHSTFNSAAGPNALEKRQLVARFFADPFAYLMQKLHDTPEGDGNMLDNTVAVQLWEHGNPGAHNVTSYIFPIVGMPDRIEHGQMIDGAGRHPSQVLQTALTAAGVPADFGAVPQTIGELLV